MASAPPISPKCIVYHPQQHKWAEERAEKPNILLCKCTRLQAMNHNPISSCNFQPFQFPIKHNFLQLPFFFQFPIKDVYVDPHSFGTKVKLLTIPTITIKQRALGKLLYVWFDHMYRFACLYKKKHSKSLHLQRHCLKSGNMSGEIFQ